MVMDSHSNLGRAPFEQFALTISYLNFDVFEAWLESEGRRLALRRAVHWGSSDCIVSYNLVPFVRFATRQDGPLKKLTMAMKSMIYN